MTKLGGQIEWFTSMKLSDEVVSKQSFKDKNYTKQLCILGLYISNRNYVLIPNDHIASQEVNVEHLQITFDIKNNSILNIMQMLECRF